ncbi:hypothetical protein JH06_3585 [Blastocystis sp. subtype 4]|uniref:hypothetical protein n=1 Tax=Blastocystis sp. subtype 4 TaxID=944170 RepID=UPI0007121B31|nr:hypothetical protein JH06_3585 [Blastocystis sp. subtype 4]KNB45560.1 hypothetical protein JH06_3585 [Blastocystis sp. subtype 4]|eukprot:XP_014529006.1 hypothetical protein JH06_3585 [Blastocystis sp. subtype 4]
MSSVPGRVYDLLCFEIINSIIGENWKDVLEYKDKDGIQKIESLGFSVGYRWAEMQKIRNPAWNSLSEVMKDVCINFWVEVFGSECESMHTDNSNIFVISSKTLRPLSKIRKQQHSEDRLRLYALLYKGMLDGILSLSGFRATTSFRKNRNSGDFEFIVTAL